MLKAFAHKHTVVKERKFSLEPWHLRCSNIERVWKCENMKQDMVLAAFIRELVNSKEDNQIWVLKKSSSKHMIWELTKGQGEIFSVGSDWIKTLSKDMKDGNDEFDHKYKVGGKCEVAVEKWDIT